MTATEPDVLPGPANEGAATLITVRNGLVVELRQFSSRAEAVAAAAAAGTSRRPPERPSTLTAASAIGTVSRCPSG